MAKFQEKKYKQNIFEEYLLKRMQTKETQTVLKKKYQILLLILGG